MKPLALLGISVFGSLLSSTVVTALFFLPWLRTLVRKEALLWLVAPHMFFRFIGLSFLIPGVVSASLPKAWAAPAAYGDLVAGLLAILAVVGLERTANWAIAAVWIFNVWGLADLLFAFYEAAHVQISPGSLGAGFYLVTAIVPPLLVSHALVFRFLISKS
jgi:hypothetical protein